MPASPYILIVDGDARFARALAERVAEWGYRSDIAAGTDAALEQLADPHQRPQVLITEMQLAAATGSPDERGGDTLLRRLPVLAPGVIPVVLTGYGTIAGAVAALKLGAADYLTKPLVNDTLRDAIAAAVDRNTLLSGGAGPEAAEGATAQAKTPRGMVGGDPAMEGVYRAIEAAARGAAPVLVTGEPGTGKNLVARAVHAVHRARTGGELVVYVPSPSPSPSPDAANRELADLWTRAAQGTLLVRGIDRLSPAAHAALLAQLRSDSKDPSAVRLVATAEPGVEQALPRPLLDRVAGVRLAVPALRERPEGLDVLADHFLKRVCGRARTERSWGSAARRALADHAWPGNVRELAQAVEHAVTVSTGVVIDADDLPPTITRGHEPRPQNPPGMAAGDPAAMIPALFDGWTPTRLADALLAPERCILRAALEAHGWNRNAAARDLGIDRTTLYKKIKRFGLDRPDAAA